jgi:hypothetical protein
MAFYALVRDGNHALWRIVYSGALSATATNSDSEKIRELYQVYGKDYVMLYPQAMDKSTGYRQMLADMHSFNAILQSAGITGELPAQEAVINQTEEPKRVLLKIGIFNPLKISPNNEAIQTKVNAITSKVGWVVESVSSTLSEINIIFRAIGTPILPIAAVMCAIIGLYAVVSVSIKTIMVSKEETEQLHIKVSSLKDNIALLEGLRQDYNEGLIDRETYNQVLQETAAITQNITAPPQTSSSIISNLGQLNAGLSENFGTIAVLGLGLLFVSKI